MVNKFCPKCGIAIDKGKTCLNCTKSPLALQYEVPLIQVSEFNRMFHRGVWRKFKEL